MNLLRFIAITFTFLTLPIFAQDFANCPAGAYCNIPGVYRPAAVFGSGIKGIQTIRQGVVDNEDLISAILRHDLTIDSNNENPDNFASRIIAPKINRAYELEPADFIEPLVIPAIGYVLNPELFSTSQDTSAALNRLSYPKRGEGDDAFSGVKIQNFGLSDIRVDFENFAQDINQSSIKICGQIKLDVQTSLSFNFNARDGDYPITLDNVDIPIDTKDTKELCFNARMNMTTFGVESIERIGDDPIITRANLQSAMDNPSLKIALPGTTPLSGLDQPVLNRIAAGYLVPVLSDKMVLDSIEKPIVTNVKEVLQSQLNTLITSTLADSNQSMNPEIKIPMFNISNEMLFTILEAHVVEIEKLQQNKNSSCNNLNNRMENINYWINQNPLFRNDVLSARIGNIANTINSSTHRCRGRNKEKQKKFHNVLTDLKSNAAKLIPTQDQTEELLIRQITSLGEKGNLEVQVFIPELCEGDYTSALAGREPPASCDNFYSMLDLSYINNYLATQVANGSLCNIHKNGKCGIRILDGDGSGKEADKDPQFACEDTESIAVSGMGEGNMRATISLKNCQSKGKRSAINLGLWHLGTFKKTDFQISFDVKLSNKCPAGKKICFDMNFRDDLFDYQGGLTDSSLERHVKSAMVEEIKKLEDKLAAGLNSFPIEDFAVGLDVSEFFGSKASETSPGHIGACLKTNENSGSREQICVIARQRLPANHPTLIRDCGRTSSR